MSQLLKHLLRVSSPAVVDSAIDGTCGLGRQINKLDSDLSDIVVPLDIPIDCTGFDDLPEHLLERIFSYLGFSNRRNHFSVCAVSKTWRRIGLRLFFSRPWEVPHLICHPNQLFCLSPRSPLGSRSGLLKCFVRRETLKRGRGRRFKLYLGKDPSAPNRARFLLAAIQHSRQDIQFHLDGACKGEPCGSLSSNAFASKYTLSLADTITLVPQPKQSDSNTTSSSVHGDGVTINTNTNNNNNNNDSKEEECWNDDEDIDINAPKVLAQLQYKARVKGLMQPRRMHVVLPNASQLTCKEGLPQLSRAPTGNGSIGGSSKNFDPVTVAAALAAVSQQQSDSSSSSPTTSSPTTMPLSPLGRSASTNNNLPITPTPASVQHNNTNNNMASLPQQQLRRRSLEKPSAVAVLENPPPEMFSASSSSTANTTTTVMQVPQSNISGVISAGFEGELASTADSGAVVDHDRPSTSAFATAQQQQTATPPTKNGEEAMNATKQSGAMMVLTSRLISSCFGLVHGRRFSANDTHMAEEDQQQVGRKQAVGLGGSSLLRQQKVVVPLDEVLQPVCLKNKAPHWNEGLRCWCLNFRGRVKLASVKNFQLVRDDDPREKVVMQFGKVDKDLYVLDFNPTVLTAVQALSIALSTFNSKFLL